MDKLALLGAVLVMATPAAAMAASPLDGTWKTDLKSVSTTGKPVVYLIQDGAFSCSTCVPPYKIKADGVSHALPPDTELIDHLAVTVTNDHSLRAVGSKGTTEKGVQVWTVSPDGRTLTIQFNRQPLQPGGPPVSSTNVYTRVAAGPAGSHAASGSWRREAVTAMSDSASTMTIKVAGPAIDWSSAEGISYHATSGAKPVPLRGDPNGVMVTVQKVSDHKYVETDWRKGKKVEIDTYTVAPDGKSLSLREQFLDTGHTTTLTANKI